MQVFARAVQAIDPEMPVYGVNGMSTRVPADLRTQGQGERADGGASDIGPHREIMVRDLARR